MNTCSSPVPAATVAPSLSASNLDLDPASSRLPGLLKDPAERRRVRAAWKAYVANMAVHASGEHKGPSARDLVVYCLLLGVPLHRAFTPVTNPVKLANGQRPFGATLNAVRTLHVAHRGRMLDDLLGALGFARAEGPGEHRALGRRNATQHYPVEVVLQQAARETTEQALELAYSSR